MVKTGKTPVLDGAEWRKLIDSIPTNTGLRDRALIALTYSFARITAALRMKVEDLRPQSAGWQIQLHEKGGKQHVMPCHHALAEALRAYIDAAGIAEDRKGWLFRTARGTPPRPCLTSLEARPAPAATPGRYSLAGSGKRGGLRPVALRLVFRPRSRTFASLCHSARRALGRSTMPARPQYNWTNAPLKDTDPNRGGEVCSEGANLRP